MNAVKNSAHERAIDRIDVAQAYARQRQGSLLIDVRDDNERAAGAPKDSIHLPLAGVEVGIAKIAADHNKDILMICASGQRSLRAADALKGLGYLNVASVDGGYTRWSAEGLPVEPSALDPDAAARYSRHLLLPEVGVAGQQRLLATRVALIGAGGLGSPAALYLAAAGVGSLTLIDDDKVEKSNLQRQVLHTDDRVGMAKTESARVTLNALNPGVHVELHNERLLAQNVESLLSGHDIVIDGADNFPTRYLLNAACQRLKLPLVYGAVHRFTGQVSVFDSRRDDSPCYRCLFPEPPAAEDAPNCAEAGVLGVLPGIIGLLQASEALKLALGIGQPLVGRLLCFDALAASFRELKLQRDPQCPGCGDDAVLSSYEDIAKICASH
jgi:sulfur-carrier protein adenylyltransferase/sulfurtransferase